METGLNKTSCLTKFQNKWSKDGRAMVTGRKSPLTMDLVLVRKRSPTLLLLVNKFYVKKVDNFCKPFILTHRKFFYFSHIIDMGLELGSCTTLA